MTASRIEAVLEVERSRSLDPAQKARVLRKLGPVVTAVAQDARSQARNRALALDRLESKLTDALAKPKRRRPTKPSRAARRRRLETKRRHSEKKRRRRPPSESD